MSSRVPNEAFLNFCLHEGAVFYLQDRALTSPEPHFFVVLNHNPSTEGILLLVVSSSQIESVKKRHSSHPSETRVEIAEQEYAGFTKDSIVSCNQVFKKTKQQLIQQINSGGDQKPALPKPILEKLREGVLASPTVERYIRKML